MDNFQEELTYVKDKPSVSFLRRSYESTVTELESYFDLCRTSYDDRRNYWPGKTPDMRKHGSDAFPWEGASDMESHVIDERIGKLVSIFMSSLNRANVRGFPINSDDVARSKVVSSFLKWMVSSGYIPRFHREMELGANYLLERGILVTYVGWQREDRRFLQNLSLDQITEIDPEVGEAIASGTSDEMLVQMMQKMFNGVTPKRIKKALKSLRKTGFAELPTVRRQVDAPLVKTLAPDADFFFPSYVSDPQQAPYCFRKAYYTPQDLENKIITDNWDEDFVELMLNKHTGVDVSSIEREPTSRGSISFTNGAESTNDLIELVHGYQRLIDQEDGSEGIYETVFHKDFDGSEEVQGYAKFELMNGYEDYPVIVTKLSEDSKRLYDTSTIPSRLRGIQNQVKLERDSRADRNSISTLPPIMHPVGQAPTDWGPGRKIPYRRKGDLEFGPVPAYNAGSVEMERTMEDQADRLVGLDVDNPISQAKRQFEVDKFLSHAAEVLALAFKNFQRFGPDSLFFRVSGDMQKFDKGSPDENYDIFISYDVLNSDPETQQKKLEQMVSLSQLDRNGMMDINSLLEIAVNSIDPLMADKVLQPVEQAQEQTVKQVTDDLAKIFAGIEMPARPNGAQIAMSVIQQYAQQPDIAQRMQQDEAFGGRIQKYAGQYQFQMQQAQNAEIGKIGGAPAQMGEINTQQMQ
tara:strand:- start:2395 stop:4470 length:2076 start_codon:yes stop_codon:yes gene_type:complete